VVENPLFILGFLVALHTRFGSQVGDRFSGSFKKTADRA